MRRPGASLFFYDRKGWIAWRAMICPRNISEGKEKGKPAETGSPDKAGFEKQTFLKIFLKKFAKMKNRERKHERIDTRY
ncbi:MAG: hypothetical protein V8S93_06465 [Lachnospiraceae bacterium]